MGKKIGEGILISINDANTMIKRQLLLNSFLKRTAKPNTPDGLEDDMDEFITRNVNAFIFDKGTIDRFFENEDTNYMVVLLGAHPNPEELERKLSEEEKKMYPPGSYTILVTGCKDINSESLDLKIVDIDKPVTEYPPSLLKLLVKTQDRVQDDNDEIGGFKLLNHLEYLEHKNEIREEFRK